MKAKLLVNIIYSFFWVSDHDILCSFLGVTDEEFSPNSGFKNIGVHHRNLYSTEQNSSDQTVCILGTYKLELCPSNFFLAKHLFLAT